MKDTILIIPGMGSSDEIHWQSHWERNNPEFIRVEQNDWETPDYKDWLTNLEKEIALHQNVIIVAHSMGCILTANFGRDSIAKIKGALLVAPPDPENSNFPISVKNFVPINLDVLPFPSLVVASTTDRYATLERSLSLATSWGADFINIGDYGHINSASNLGDWDEGFEIFKRFKESLS